MMFPAYFSVDGKSCLMAAKISLAIRSLPLSVRAWTLSVVKMRFSFIFSNLPLIPELRVRSIKRQE